MHPRKTYAKLLGWKRRSHGTSSLLVEGARRVGKTTLVQEFGRREYRSTMLLDMSLATDDFKQTFLDLRTDLDGLFLYLSSLTGVRLYERESLIVFDEVQLFPEARSFLKHLVADGRYDYIETGSLVSIKQNVQGILLPSEEEAITLHPFDFEEFLWAQGEQMLAESIRRSFETLKPLPEPLHRKAGRLWREYLLVGGLPQAVEAFLASKDLESADHVKRTILRLYRSDIEKYGGREARMTKALFDALPGMLAKHEKRVVFSQVKKGSRSRDFVDALVWLADSQTVNPCFNCTDPSVGLALSEDSSSVKCYMGDTGLLVSSAFSAGGSSLAEVYKHIMQDNLSINEGMLAENAVAQQLKASGHELFFYSKSSTDASERMEVDFLIVAPYEDSALKPRVSPIEVKSGRRIQTTSLDKFVRKFSDRCGTQYVLYTKELRVDRDAHRRYLPLYMSFCI